MWLSFEGLADHCFLTLCLTECMPAVAASAPVRLSLLLGHLHCSSTTVCEVSQWARSLNASSWKATRFYFLGCYFRINLLKLHCHWVWNFLKSSFKVSVVLGYAASPFWVESWSLFVFSFHSLLETVLEAFHFDHKTLEKQLVTIENQGELSAPDCRNTTSNCWKCS